jgi:predicted nucleotidyltransferase
VQLVYAFGSALRPGAAAPRDLDLALWAQPALELGEILRLRADLVLEIRAPIDLVSLNDASIALAREVVETGECLFARTQDVETGFVVRARARYWDFAPYRDEQWRLAGERLEARRLGPPA